MILPYQDKHGHGMASVFFGTSGKLIGQAGIFHIGHYDLQPEIKIGYRFHKNYGSKVMQLKSQRLWLIADLITFISTSLFIC